MNNRTDRRRGEHAARSLTLRCGTHGSDQAWLVCSHIVDDGAQPWEYVPPSDDGFGGQVVCERDHNDRETIRLVCRQCAQPLIDAAAKRMKRDGVAPDA